MRKHPNGRVDQLEDRYLGMVEAPSSNLGTSTPFLLIYIDEVKLAAKTVHLSFVSVFGSANPLSYRKIMALNDLILGKTSQYTP